ncbi:uncharacterized protein LOC111705073 [Eurytemora carolleeae]|uniref:uncharacterized protein LOC111705073 n=1 Tax=Eurytemora carolleeae TaxID=1294199 RepID=UPI000C78707C|nr:uncharacterized protein LOC111705073 [Eurytemora carolleeae]|eukprot:XP_023333274.1 uncharacterized protein LOC111705073 [Eurytemora affinis]
MREILVDIGEGLAQLTDLYLETRLAPVARTIRLSAVHSNIQSCLRLLVGFGGLDYSEISLILSRLDTVRSLVALAVSSQSKHLRILALRALSSVCSTQEMIRDLEDCGGVEVVCGFLTSIPCTQTKVECAGILAQITSPWLLQDKRLSPSFRTWIPQIISGLVNLLQQYSNPLEESTSSCEHPEQQGSPSRPLSPLELDGEQLFLIYAALSHLCCLEPESTKLLIKENRIRTLIFEVGRKNLSSVNLVEQLINILEELSRTEKERMRTDENILRFLLNQVQNEDHKFQRIRNKSASILTSLASTPSVFNDVLLSGQLAQTARRASRRSRVVTSPLNKSKKTLSQSDQLASSHCVERRTSPGSKQVERRASVILKPDDRRASSTWNSVDQLASSPLLATQCGRLMQSVGNCSVYSFLNETIQL